MAPTTFHLVKLNNSATGGAFLQSIRSLPSQNRPLYIGQCHHWIHAPHLSVEALTGSGDTMQRWDYLLILTTQSLPDTLKLSVEATWSITAIVDDELLANLAEAKRQRGAAITPPLPQGWCPTDHSGLDAAEPPSDLETSLALSSYRLGSPKDSNARPVALKNWVAEFGSRHTGPVQMFNLLSYLPSGRAQYFKYVAAFIESVGSSYGGDPVFIGFGGVVDWSSKDDEQNEEGVGWEDCALIHYPSIWHFAKMLDDPAYADVDRRFKQGALRDNPLVCCSEIDLE
ncbi:uncharacterized protein LTR77_000503 [Saxophila tyrrhenica]|uniref:DUF1330 domain-containing protein n=1 Tax=Saxophila tyrrhenica TaxID=1690608 RepID=A0AAV9PN63_9PEZI|nr:hypothetical protein LTR77_000503 [Saxophila tyrrhenica]